jgi:NAD(P)-dependent dehydrogenase (short-subunit alcohol dehydrogenase family)
MSGLPPNGALAGRFALVTGAARNIGRATAVAIAAAGGRVLATDIDQVGLDDTARQIRSAFGDRAVATSVADLVDADAADQLVGAAVAAHGRLDVVVHAAVDHGRGRLEELTVEQWNRTYAINVAAAAWLVRAAVPHLARSRGAVVLFSSIQARGGLPGHSLYASTKGAIESLTRHLAAELGSQQIRVNAISPGWVMEGVPRDGLELPSYPLGRYGHPDEIAAAVVFLASDAAAWITGTVLPVDGGTHAIHPGWAARRANAPSRATRWKQRLRRFGGRSRR